MSKYDYDASINEIRKYLNLEEKEDIGEVLLLKYFENVICLKCPRSSPALMCAGRNSSYFTSRT